MSTGVVFLKFAFLSAARSSSLGKRVAVVGAGPAGLSAAGYLACRNYEVDVYDKLPAPGGLMTFAIPSHRISPERVLEGCRDLEGNFGVKFHLRRKAGSSRSRDEGDEFAVDAVDIEKLVSGYSAVLIATGTWRSRHLNVSGEESRNVLSALEFLHRIKLAELGYASYDVRCVGRVVVVGAGLSAVDAAETALMKGAEEVYLTYRRTIKEAPAGSYRIKELSQRGVKFIELAQPTRIVAEGGEARAVEFTRMRLGEPDETGRPKPVPIPGTGFTLEADLVVTAVGELPTPPAGSEMLVRYLGTDGRIMVEKDYRVPETNIYAAGDVVSGPTKIGLAVDSALRAARSLDLMLTGEMPSIGEILKSSPVRELVLEFVRWDGSVEGSLCRFLGVNAGVDAGRCLSSAPFLRVFDYGKCIGCETCSNVCSFVHEGRSLIKIQKTGEGLVFPTACMHCSNAKCVSACKRNAIRRGPLGEILIDYTKCNNCLDCMHSCPVKAIRIRGGSVVNCDLCKPLRDRGLRPACMAMCPSDAVTLYISSSTSTYANTDVWNR
ncbi:MAG: FAD-dependent oxidoreductase [Zestosphaera sp.]